jgi:hypothetical protein
LWAQIGGWTGMGMLFLIVFGYAMSRIKKVEEECMTKEICNERCNSLKDRLDKGDDKFNQIDEKLEKHLVILTRIDQKTIQMDEILRNLAQRNG